MALLEIVTRCYARTILLAANQTSLRGQTDRDWQQTLLVDNVGRGVTWANAQLASFEPAADTGYVWLLDDDDLCIAPNLVADVRRLATLHAMPPAIIVRMDHGPMGVLPDDEHWRQPPALTRIGCSAIITRADVWRQHRQAWASGRYEADFDFIAAVWQAEAFQIIWHDLVASRVQRVSRGAPE